MGLGTKLVNLKVHNLAIFISKLYGTDIILGRDAV